MSDDTKTESNPSNVEFIVDATILKCDIKGGFQKNENSKTLIVLGAPENPQKISIQEMINDFKKSDPKMEETLTKSLNGDGNNALDSMKIQLNTMYYKKTWEKKDEKYVDGVNEYAFSVDVLTEGLLKSIGIPESLIKVDRIKLKIWNVDDQKILDRLNFSEMTNLLAA